MVRYGSDGVSGTLAQPHRIEVKKKKKKFKSFGGSGRMNDDEKICICVGHVNTVNENALCCESKYSTRAPQPKHNKNNISFRTDIYTIIFFSRSVPLAWLQFPTSFTTIRLLHAQHHFHHFYKFFDTWNKSSLPNNTVAFNFILSFLFIRTRRHSTQPYQSCDEHTNGANRLYFERQKPKAPTGDCLNTVRWMSTLRFLWVRTRVWIHGMDGNICCSSTLHRFSFRK